MRWPIKLLILMQTLAVSACSRDDKPDAQAGGAQIFQASCVECHKPAYNGSLLILTAEKANPQFIAHKIQNGSWLMPAFPKMTQSDLTKLSNYVLENTDISGD